MITTWSRGPADRCMPEAMLVQTLEKVRWHPWWHARARIALSLLHEHEVLPPAEVLDAGCGWGVTLDALEKQHYRAVGLDISPQILAMIDRPDRRLIEADLSHLGGSGHARFDAALALDVLEHVDDDKAVVRALAGLLKPGASLVVSVPALPDLFSEFDVIQGHRRRYLPDSLRDVFEGSGIVLQRVFWWGAWMVPVLRRMRRPAAAGRTPAKSYSEHLRLPPWPASAILTALHRWEERRALAGRLETGTSLFATGVRPD